MSNSCKRNANIVKTFRVTTAENAHLLSAAKQKGVGISTFCRDAALEAAGQKRPDEAARSDVASHARLIGEMLAAACIIQRLLRVTEATSSSGRVVDHDGEILDACNRIIAAANDIVGDAS